MRAAIHHLLNTAGPAELRGRWHASTGTDGDIDQTAGLPRPFGVFRCAGRYPGVGSVTQSTLEIWVHDDYGSYVRIDELLKEIKDVLRSAVPLHHAATDTWIYDLSWTNDSPDLYDETRRTNNRMASYNVVGTGA